MGIEKITDINKLNADAKVFVEFWLDACKAQGVSVQVIETLRTKERQKYLYSLGRTVKGKIVTMTMNSVHLSGNAFDFAVLDKKGNINWNDIKTYKKAGALAVKLGGIYGGDFKNIKDYGHIEYNGVIIAQSKPIVPNKIKSQAAYLVNSLVKNKIVTNNDYWYKCAIGAYQLNSDNLRALIIKLLKFFKIDIRDDKTVTLVTLLKAHDFITDMELWKLYLNGDGILSASNLRALFTKISIKMENKNELGK